MFYRVKLRDKIRVTPDLFGLSVDESVTKMIKRIYEGYISETLGVVIDVDKINEVNEGVVLPGDGSVFYDAEFELLTYIPELSEVVYGKVRDISDFGAFLVLGPIEGMVHVSQSMDDFVSFSKDKVFVGRDSKRSLKVGDVCRARIIALSFKDIANPKIGLTMRQPGLGKLEWINEDLFGEKKVREKKKK